MKLLGREWRGEERGEREGERSPLSRVCRGLRAVSGSKGGGRGAPGEGRRASRRRLPHPAKRLLPLNRQNRIYLTQPWRRRRRVRASLPRHAVARRARFRCFHSSLPFRNPRRPHPLPFPPRSTPTYPPPPRLPIVPGKTKFSFLPSSLLYMYIYIYISSYACVCVCHREPLPLGAFVRAGRRVPTRGDSQRREVKEGEA